MPKRLMLMTTPRLIAIRIYMRTLGRLPVFERALRRVLVTLLVTRRRPGERYGAATRYFDTTDVNSGEYDARLPSDGAPERRRRDP